MDDTAKLALIRKIVDIQVWHQNDEDGDRHLADANLAMEAIECVLDAWSETDFRRPGNGALRQYTEAMS